MERPEILKIEARHRAIRENIERRNRMYVFCIALCIFAIAVSALLTVRISALEAKQEFTSGTVDRLQIEFEKEREAEEETAESVDKEAENVGEVAENVARAAAYDAADFEMQRDIIERVVAAEARGDSLEGMIAVATVIKNRSEIRGLEPVDVVTQEAQFAKPYEGEISEDVKRAVSLVFDKGFKACEEPIAYFHNKNEKPAWAEFVTSVGALGSTAGHIFYY